MMLVARRSTLLSALLSAVTAALLLGGCMESQMLAGEDRYGTVTTFASDIPGGIYPAYIATVDGKNVNTIQTISPTRTGLGTGAGVATSRYSIRLPPGDHEIRLVADLTQATGTLNREINDRSSGANATIKLYVEEGRRYYLGARIENSRRSDWEAVVWRVEDDESYDHSIMH